MKNICKISTICIISIIIIICAMGIGSVYISPIDTLNILFNKIFGYSLYKIDDIYTAILLEVRIPRVFLAFICGVGLSVSGAVMQAVLRNPLASSYTVGVSSGAGFGASLVILFDITIFGIFSLQIFGATFGIMTVILAILFVSKVDKRLENNTIILIGMVFSLFLNAGLSIMITFSREELKSLVSWQMGSFSAKDNVFLYIAYPVVFIILFILILKYRELDILSFGDEEASVSGIDTKKSKWIFILLSAILTGATISICGIIGFVDLFIPHISRKIFGASHKYVLPMSAILGGVFMVVSDLIARSIIPPRELPIGAITAIIGAPFFVYLYFERGKK